MLPATDSVAGITLALLQRAAGMQGASFSVKTGANASTHRITLYKGGQALKWVSANSLEVCIRAMAEDLLTSAISNLADQRESESMEDGDG